MRNTNTSKRALETIEIVRGYKAGRITCGHDGNFRDCRDCRTVHDGYIDEMLDLYVELAD